MVSIKNTQVFGLERALIASGNSYTKGEINTLRDTTDRDWKRGLRLGKAPNGSGHDNFLKGIIVQFDITYPQYWTPQFQRYKFIDIVSSTSKMHCLAKCASQSFEEFKKRFNQYVDGDLIRRTQEYAQQYNELANTIPDEASQEQHRKDTYNAFMRLQSNLPLGYELEMTVSTNYLQLKTIVSQRRNHPLKEDWGSFCDWCCSLPHFKELTGIDG